MIGHAECGGHEIRDARSNEDWHTEHTQGPVWVTAWRLYQDAHALCQQHAILTRGAGEGCLSFTPTVWMFDFTIFFCHNSFQPQSQDWDEAMTLNYHLSDALFRLVVSVQLLSTTWLRMWACPPRGGWSSGTTRRCWGSYRWRRDRPTKPAPNPRRLLSFHAPSSPNSRAAIFTDKSMGRGGLLGKSNLFEVTGGVLPVFSKICVPLPPKRCLFSSRGAETIPRTVGLLSAVLLVQLIRPSTTCTLPCCSR